MHSRILMTVSAIVLGAVGIVLNFAPQEIAAWAGFSGMPLAALALQLMAGLYLGMGVLNWMSRGQEVGGIFGRAVAMGNLLQFAVGAFALVRAILNDVLPTIAWAAAAVYVILAVAFAWAVMVGWPQRAPGR